MPIEFTASRTKMKQQHVHSETRKSHAHAVDHAEQLHRFGDDAEALRLSYLRYQFTRLGLPTGPSHCGDGHGLQAELEGAENGRGAVVYYALWTDNAQVAGVLEIAERFMTSRPRPAHAVIFRFGAEPHPVPAGCNPAENAGRVIQPEHLPTGDAMALVDKLIALQRQGR